MRTIVKITCGVSVGLASISAVSHYFMGIDKLIPILECVQLFLEVCFWIFAVRTKKYRLAFELQIGVDFIGISVGTVLGGTMFLHNSFWVALISPLYIISGNTRLGYTFLTISLLQIVGLYWWLSPEPTSVPTIILMDSFLFTLSMMILVVTVKRWQDRLQVQVEKAEAEMKRFRESKIQHLVTINHELRTPISTLASAIGMLKEGLAAAFDMRSIARNEFVEKQNFLIDTIQNTSHHVLAVLNEVLDTERLEAGVDRVIKTRFLVRRLSTEVIDSFAVQAVDAGSSLKLRVAKGVSDEWVGPEKQIRQVLINLISNALKHAKGADITISVIQNDDRLVFQIADTGPGMSAHVQKHLFEPFASSMGASGTSGLGLGICKLLVEKQMGGSISVHSELGVGTTFIVSVPVSRFDGLPQVQTAIAPSLSTQDAAEVSASQMRGKRLLLVEDDNSYGQILTLALSKAGLIVECAQTSQNAMELMRDRPKFDVAVIDYNLGPASLKDGVGLVVDLLSAQLGKVVGYTGNYSDDLEKRWTLAGVHCVARKPILIPELISLLETIYFGSLEAQSVAEDQQ